MKRGRITLAKLCFLPVAIIILCLTPLLLTAWSWVVYIKRYRRTDLFTSIAQDLSLDDHDYSWGLASMLISVILGPFGLLVFVAVDPVVDYEAPLWFLVGLPVAYLCADALWCAYSRWFDRQMGVE